MMSNTIIEEIERISYLKQCDYIDAVVEFCEKNKLEIEMIAEIIKNEPALKMKLHANAVQLNLIKGRGATLPI